MSSEPRTPEGRPAMAEVETLAEVLAEHVYEVYRLGKGGAQVYLPDWSDATSRALVPGVEARRAEQAVRSWLASVLADDATVEVVARAYRSRWGDMGGPEYLFSTVARVALAALSAHLTAPARAGDTSGEEGL